VAAFQSTLTEAREATLLVHVVDASDPRRAAHIEQVNSVLREIGAEHIPQIQVYNKIDRLAAAAHTESDPLTHAVAVWISAARGEGLDLLQQAIAERLARAARRATLRVPAAAGALRSSLYARDAVRHESSDADGSIELTVELPDIELLELARTPGVQILKVDGDLAACTPADAYLQSPASASAAKLP